MDSTGLKREIFSGVFWRFGERFAAKGVSFVVSLVLARILMPEDYGVVAMVNVFISLADILVSGGLSSALIQNKDAGQNDFSTIFYCNFLFSLFIYFILFFSAPLIADFYNMPSLVLILRVFSLKLLPASFQAIQVAYVSKKMMFRKFFFATLGGTIVSAVVGIVMAINGYGAWALVAQYMTNTVIDTLILFLSVKWKPSLYFKPKESVYMIKYGWNIMCTGLIGGAFNQLNAFIIGKRFTAADLAYYDRGKSLPSLLTDNISTALMSVLFPAMSNAGDKEVVKKIAKKSTCFMSYIMFPIMVGLIVTTDALVRVLFTEKWIGAIPYIRLVCLEGMISVVDSTNGIQVLKAMGYSGRNLRLEFIKKPIYIGVLLYAMQYGVMGIALTVPLNAFIGMIINTSAASKVSGYTIAEQLRDCFPAFWMSAVMGISVWVIGVLELPAIATFSLQVLAGGVIYVLLSVITRNQDFYMILNTVKGMGKRKGI